MWKVVHTVLTTTLQSNGYGQILLLFFFFSLDSPTEVTCGWILTHNGSKHALWCLFGVHTITMADNSLGFKFPKNRQKIVWVSTKGFNMNDVIEDWRHWCHSVACLPWLVERRILFIAYWESQCNASIIRCTIFWQSLYRLCRQSVLQGVSCAVLLGNFQNFDTLIRKRRTLREPFDLALT